MTLTIQKKLIGLVFLSLLSIVFMGLLAIRNMNLITSNLAGLFHGHLPAMSASRRALVHLDSASDSLNTILLINDPAATQEINQHVADFNNKVFQFDMFINAIALGSESEEFKNLDGGIVYSSWVRNGFGQQFMLGHSQHANSSSTETIGEIDRLTDNLVTNAQDAIAIKRRMLRLESEGNQTEANEQFEVLVQKTTNIQNSKTQVLGITEEFLDNNANEVEGLLTQEEEKANTIIMRTIAITIIVLFGAFIVSAYYIRKLVTRPIQELTKVAKDISTGKLDTRIDPKTLSSNDEIGKLAQAFDRTVISLKLAMKDQSKQSTPPPSPEQ